MRVHVIRKVGKGAWRMPWLSEAMKDVISCDDVRLVASLFVQRSTITIEYGSLNLAVLAGYIVDISR